jgi:hypothetical protein
MTKCNKCGVDPDDMVKLINECRDRLAKKEIKMWVDRMNELHKKWALK